MRSRIKALCPVCADNVPLEAYMEIGASVACPGCDALLKIIEIDPPELAVDSGDDDDGLLEENEDDEDVF